MDSARESEGLLKAIGLGALIWAVGGATYGVAEVLVNNVMGLYLPLRLWLFAIFVYAVLGLMGGLGAGFGLGIVRGLLSRMGLALRPLLMSSFLATLVLAIVGIPINDRALPGVLDPSSLIVNSILIVACAGLGAVFYLFLRGESGSRLPLAYIVIAFCVSLCLAVGLFIDGYVPSLATTTKRVIAFAVVALLGGVLFLGLRRLLLVPRGRVGAARGMAAAVLIAGAILAAHASAQSEKEAKGEAAAPAKRPNVLWLVMDTTRPDHLGVYGYPKGTTPNLDKIAKESAVFENAIAQSSWTMPTHFQMVTSRVESGTKKLLEPEYPTAAEIFKHHGYETAAVIANFSIGRQSGFGQGFDTFVDGPAMIFYLYAFDNVPVVKMLLKLGIFPPDAVLRMLDIKIFRDAEAVRAETITDHAIDAVDDRDEDKPFFLFLNYMDPHDSYDPPQPYRDRFAPGADPLVGFQRFDSKKLKSISSNEFVRDVMPKLDEKAWKDMVNLYDAEIAYMDEHIGRLLDALKERGLYDDTIIVITADHGELFGEHGLANHFKALTEEEIHVPLMIHYPKVVPVERIDTTVETSDILPTLLALTDIKVDIPMDGHDLMPLIRGDAGAADEHHGEAFSYLIREPDKKFPHTAPGHLFALRRGDSKLVWSSGGKHEYYDITKDKQGRENHFADHPDITEAQDRLSHWRDKYGLSSLHSYEDEKLDSITHDRLKALGYVE